MCNIVEEYVDERMAEAKEELDKEKSTEKIDGVVATIMALDRAIRCGLDNGESVYDERGILLI